MTPLGRLVLPAGAEGLLSVAAVPVFPGPYLSVGPGALPLGRRWASLSVVRGAVPSGEPPWTFLSVVLSEPVSGLTNYVSLGNLFNEVIWV